MDDVQWNRDYAARKKAQYEANMVRIQKAHESFADMDRSALIDALFWLSPGSGTGYGMMSFTGMILQNMQRPRRKEDDWKSVVAIKADTRAHATDDELRWLLAFSRIKTEDYDCICGYRMGVNLYIMGVEEGWGGKKAYYHKRQSWESGKFWSDTMAEAIEFSAQVAL